MKYFCSRRLSFEYSIIFCRRSSESDYVSYWIGLTGRGHRTDTPSEVISSCSQTGGHPLCSERMAWVWVDNSPMQFAQWEDDQPQSATGLGGLRNLTGEFRLSSLISYYNGYPFICERKITPIVDREMFKNSNGTLEVLLSNFA